MTGEKILEVVARYRAKFDDLGIAEAEHNHDLTADSAKATLEHCRQMLGQIEGFVAEGRIGKAFRWLGFAQGCLFAEGVYTIGEMADHNRPDNEEEA